METLSAHALIRCTDDTLGLFTRLHDVLAEAQSVRVHCDEEHVLVALTFRDRHHFLCHASHLRTVLAPARLEAIDLDALELRHRDELARELRHQPFTLTAGNAHTLVEWCRQRPRRPSVTLHFSNAADLKQAWAAQLEGYGLLLPGETGLEEGTDVRVELVLGKRVFPNNPARVSSVDPTGARASVSAGWRLSAWLDAQRHWDQVEVDESPALAVTREIKVPLAFADRSDYFLAWDVSLCAGSCFVPCEAPPPPRSRVTVSLSVGGEALASLDAEVVHRVTTGPLTGMGVQLSAGAHARLAELDAALRAPRKTPTVLIIDDEAVWRTSFTRLLAPRGVRVLTASNGQEGLRTLIDHFFEIDLVLLDLHMPELDGRGLLERVRTLGGESALTIFLISAAEQDELDGLLGTATLVLSKLEPIESLERIIHRALEVETRSSAA